MVSERDVWHSGGPARFATCLVAVDIDLAEKSCVVMVTTDWLRAELYDFDAKWKTMFARN